MEEEDSQAVEEAVFHPAEVVFHPAEVASLRAEAAYLLVEEDFLLEEVASLLAEAASLLEEEDSRPAEVVAFHLEAAASLVRSAVGCLVSAIDPEQTLDRGESARPVDAFPVYATLPAGTDSPDKQILFAQHSLEVTRLEST